jgi:hypothetical protein
MSKLTEELARRGLSEHRAGPVEDSKRALEKQEFCRAYSESHPDAMRESHDREASAGHSLVTHVTLLTPDAALGKKTNRNLQKGRGKRSGHKGHLRRAIETVCDEIEVTSASAVLSALENNELMASLYNSDPPLIDIRVQEIRDGMVFYVLRDGREKKATIKRIKNILASH